TRSDPNVVPAKAAVNVRLIVQLAPGASVAGETGQLLDWAKGLVMRKSETVSASAPLFVSVTVWGGLVTPTLWPGKSRLAVGSVATGACPVPLSETACGLPAALSAIVSEPTRVPPPVGVKVTL